MELSAFTKSFVNVLTIIVTTTPWILKGLDILPGTSGTAVATIISAVAGVAGAIIHVLAPNTTVDPVKAENQSVRLKKNVARKRVVKTNRV